MPGKRPLTELIAKYVELTIVCDSTDYADKKSVKNHNKAAKEISLIADLITTEFGETGINEFAKLIDHKEYGTNIWAAIYVLNKMKVDNLTEKRALAVVKQEADQSIGMRYWLKNYEEKKKNLK